MAKSIKLKNDFYFNGEIYEMGSNSDGNYVKWANGLMICYGKIDITTPIDLVRGNGYYKSVFVNKNFPKSFVSLPSITASVVNTNWCYIGQLTYSKDKLDYITLQDTKSDTNMLFTVNYIAIGCWK